MRIHFLPIFLRFLMSNSTTIKNNNCPACRNCIHLRPHIFIGTDVDQFSKCGKFGEKDVLTNKVTHYFADSCRRDSDRCGLEGKMFEYDKFSEIKIILLSIVGPINLMLLGIFLTFIIALSK